MTKVIWLLLFAAYIVSSMHCNHSFAAEALSNAKVIISKKRTSPFPRQKKKEQVKKIDAISTKNDNEVDNNALHQKDKKVLSRPKQLILNYVSPITNPDYRDIKRRINFYGKLAIGPLFSFSGVEPLIFGNQQTSIGLEIHFDMMYFAFETTAYTLFGKNIRSVVNYEYTMGDNFGTFAYTFGFMLGYVIDRPNLPLMKAYLLYRDAQLQVTIKNKDDDMLPYYSRNIGAGYSVNVRQYIDVGTELYFTLLHSNNGMLSGTSGIPSLGWQLFVKFAF